MVRRRTNKEISDRIKRQKEIRIKTKERFDQLEAEEYNRERFLERRQSAKKNQSFKELEEQVNEEGKTFFNQSYKENKKKTKRKLIKEISQKQAIKKCERKYPDNPFVKGNELKTICFSGVIEESIKKKEKINKLKK